MLKSDISNENKLATLLDFDNILGLKLQDKTENEIEITSDIQIILEERKNARENKDWAKSDELRITKRLGL
jgi:cysteinyl-tRNA synthetase